MTVDVVNLTGKKVSSASLPKEVFSVEVKPEVLAMAIRVHQANQHQKSSQVKSRGQITRTTAKVWRQKGTGRARHGSRRAPIFVGGGVAHGPKAATPAKLKLTKKTRRLALLGALTTKANQKAITLVEGMEKLEPKSKAARAALGKIASYQHQPKDKILLVLPSATPNVIKAHRNLPGVTLTQATRLNIYEIINANQLIITTKGLDLIRQTYAKSNSSPTKTVKKAQS